MTIDWHFLMPLIFAGLMGAAISDSMSSSTGSIWVSASSLRPPTKTEKDRMIASIGPFWDANETWLVLAVGLLLVAFPIAHGIILYRPLSACVHAADRAHPARRGLRVSAPRCRSTARAGGT